MPNRLERVIVAVLVGGAVLWLGVKETSAAMPLALRIPLVLAGAAAMAGVVWWMGRREASCEARGAGLKGTHNGAIWVHEHSSHTRA